MEIGRKKIFNRIPLVDLEFSEGEKYGSTSYYQNPLLNLSYLVLSDQWKKGIEIIMFNLQHYS